MSGFIDEDGMEYRPCRLCLELVAIPNIYVEEVPPGCGGYRLEVCQSCAEASDAKFFKNSDHWR